MLAVFLIYTSFIICLLLTISFMDEKVAAGISLIVAIIVGRFFAYKEMNFFKKKKNEE